MRYWFLFLALGACAHGGENLPAVHAAAETAPVGSMDDAADDPAIWINRNDPAASLILGTDKQAGLYVYDLSGAVKQFTPAGELNNVDLRQNRRLGDFSGDIAAASNRSDNTVALFSVNGDGAAPMGAFPSAFPEPYGLCMGAWGEDTLVFVTHKTGDLVMYRLTGTRSGEETGRLKFKSQLEGCVFDDETGALFIGEEARGVWKSSLSAGALEAPRLIGPVGGTSGVKADVEGLALYKTGPNAGYLIASSQGNNSYAVYEFGGDNAFLGRFAIRPGAAIDGAEETDGIEATSMALGPDYPRGVLAVQDGYNDPQGSAQNYKIVDWRDIENALGLE